MNQIHRTKSRSSFNETMEEATRLMPFHQRVFSKVIHSKTLSTLNEFVGTVIVRPNPLLLGAVTSFGFTLVTYLMAKNLGYRLSGFEPIAAFVIGWLLGFSYDLLRVMTTGKTDE